MTTSSVKPTLVASTRLPAPDREQIGYPGKTKAQQAAADKRGLKVPGMPTSPAEVGFNTEVDCYVAGRNGIKYPAKLCTTTGRLRILDQDGVHPLKKSWDLLAWRPVGLKARVAFMKAAGDASPGANGNGAAAPKHPKMSKDELESMNLRWITIHPNGEDEEGRPVLVHDDGTHYTVVGGAGGKLNQLVLPHGNPKTQAEMKEATKARQAKREERKQGRAAENPEGFKEYEAKKEAIKEAVKERTSALQQELQGEFGRSFSMENLHQMARQKALETNPQASEGEVQQFQKQAEQQVKKGLKQAAEKVVRDHMDDQSLRDMNVNVDKHTRTTVRAKVFDRDFLAEISPERRAEIVQQVVGIDKLKREAAALDKALQTGNFQAIQGMEMLMKDRDPSDQEVEEWTRQGYLSRKETLTQVALTKGALDAAPSQQSRYQAAGASDAANAIASEFTGHSIMDPDRAQLLGPEGVAKVSAAWLAHSGIDLQEAGQKLEERHAQLSYAKAAGVIKQAHDMDGIVESAMKAAESGDGTVEYSQAANLASQFQAKKASLFCSAQGNLRSTVASHLLLSRGRADSAIQVNGGSSVTEAHHRAAQLGLGKDDYRVDKEASGYSINVPADKAHTLATPVKIVDPERDTAFAQMENDVAQNFDTKRWDGISPLRRPFQHQALAAEGITRFKRLLLNYGAGSGKTGVAYMSAAHLLNNGHIDKGIITMPASPFAEQEDGVNAETGQWEQGRRKFWLDEGTQGKFVSVGSSKQLKDACERIRNGEKLVLITTPDLARNNIDTIMSSGLGGDKSYAFIDEAQDVSAGASEGQGSKRAQAIKRLMNGAEYAVASSGTLLENDASELHYLSEAIHPGALPDVKQFSSEWQRAAQSEDPAHIARLRGLFAGRMISYHKPVQRDVHTAEGAVATRTDPRTGKTTNVREDVPLYEQRVNVDLHPAQQEAIRAANDLRKKNVVSGPDLQEKWNRQANRDWHGRDKPKGEKEDPLEYKRRLPRKNESQQEFVDRRVQQLERSTRVAAPMQFAMDVIRIATQGAWADKNGKLLRDSDGKPVKDGSKIPGAQLMNPKMDRVKEIADTMRARYAKEHADGKRGDPHFKFGLFSPELAPIAAAKKRMDDLRWTQITGAEDAGKRRAAASAINDRRPEVKRPGADAVAYTSAGNYGWNGQGMDAQFNSQALMNPGKRRQVIARGYREGQERDFHVFEMLSNDPREASLYHRVMNEKDSQRRLLEKMSVHHAEDGDDTHVASVIAANMDRVLELAGIDPEAAAQQVIGKPRKVAKSVMVLVRKAAEGKAIDVPEQGGDEQEAQAPSSIAKMHERLQHEMARSAATYDEHRKGLAKHHAAMGKELQELNAEYKDLQPKVVRAIEQGLDGEEDGKMLLRYMQVCHRRYRCSLAQQMAHHAVMPPGAQAIGKPLDTPVPKPPSGRTT